MIIEGRARFGNWIPGDILRAMKSVGHEEVEIKLRVPDLKLMRRRLHELGARRIGRVHERNVLFDTLEGSLRRAGQLLRLRWNNRDSVLTYKSPAKGSRPRRARFKVRQEIEFAVNAGAAQAMLEGAGFRAGFRYEKYRTSYVVPGAGKVKLELDETPMGCFIELEGAPSDIDRLARRLGCARGDYITANYLALFLEDCRAQEKQFGHMLFSEKKRAGRFSD